MKRFMIAGIVLILSSLFVGILSQSQQLQGLEGQQQSSSGDYSHFRRPVEDGRISAHFAYRDDPISGERQWHPGIDFAAPKGTPILAPADGSVELVSTNYSEDGRYGLILIIKHDERTKSFYAHLDGAEVETGEKVKQGQQIGTVGESGRASGPHLHYEIWQNVNPWYFLMER